MASWLEILELRAVHIDQDSINRHIKHLLKEFKNDYEIKIYLNTRVETDWNIHIHYKSENVVVKGSDIAMRLKVILKNFGLVNHTILIEQQMDEGQQGNLK
jgi:hypothetical protein